ncbi:MAG: DNA polymerase III subunit delta [Bacteroidetes bacterium]|nr:MAG: DNA polymerase III subunit delta [Bacteroidota bacterium]
MTYEQIIGDLKNKVYKPVYFLWGDEPYYIDLVSSFIAGNVLSEAEQSFNQTTLYGKDSEAAQVSDLARRFPMMASHQVVVLKEAQDMKSFGELIHYVEKPQPSTLLVISYKYKKPDKRQKIFKVLEKKAVWFESKKMYDNQVPGWIAAYASKQKYNMEPKAAALLAEFLGSDLSKIVNEVEKLTVAIGKQGETITPVLVEKHIGFSKDFNQFELQDALGKRDVLKAMRIINYFAENDKKYPFPLTIISLYYFFSKLLLFHYTKDKSKQNLAATLKVNPFFVKDYEAAAKRYSAAKLVEIISLLRVYDMRSKGYEGNTTPSRELTRELIFKILHT